MPKVDVRPGVVRMEVIGKSPVVEQPKLYLGVDPGGSGGLAYAANDGSVKDIGYGAVGMPATLRDLWHWFLDQSNRMMQTFAIVEKVGGYMPGSKGNIGSAMFKFGYSAGALEAFLVAAGIPYELVTPGVWQKGLGIPSRKKTENKTQWKNRLKAAAQRLFPDVQVTLATADALLISDFCRRKREGLLNAKG
jgi:hypothetical protein